MRDGLTDPEQASGSEFLDLETLLQQIEGSNGVACRQMYAEYQDLFNSAPGASNNHHTWEGGYRHHVEQVMNLFSSLHSWAEQNGWISHLPDSERFSLSDGLTIMWLHDLEKPFKYRFVDGRLQDNPGLKDKRERKQFREAMIERYGIQLTPEQQNALLHVEGVRDEYYTPNERVDRPLAVLCHCADLISARVLYDLRSKGLG